MLSSTAFLSPDLLGSLLSLRSLAGHVGTEITHTVALWCLGTVTAGVSPALPLCGFFLMVVGLSFSRAWWSQVPGYER